MGFLYTFFFFSNLFTTRQSMNLLGSSSNSGLWWCFCFGKSERFQISILSLFLLHQEFGSVLIKISKIIIQLQTELKIALFSKLNHIKCVVIKILYIVFAGLCTHTHISWKC